MGALCHQLNPELNKEFLINGNNFLTSFYKLSRIHEKILLGMNVSEDINDPSILKISSDFKILPAERPSTSGSSKLTRNSSSATRRHDIEKVRRSQIRQKIYICVLIVDCREMVAARH